MTSNSATDVLDDADMETDLDGEEVKTIAGKPLDKNLNKNKHENQEANECLRQDIHRSKGKEVVDSEKNNSGLIVHLMNAVGTETKPSQETICIRISNKDVDAVVQDNEGLEHPVPDIDLQIEIPKSKVFNKNSTLRGKFRNMLGKLTGGASEYPDVVVIRDTISVTDDNGRVYDLEMDLKVQIDEEHLVPMRKNSENSNFYSETTISNISTEAARPSQQTTDKEVSPQVTKEKRRKSLLSSKSMTGRKSFMRTISVPWRRHKSQPRIRQDSSDVMDTSSDTDEISDFEPVSILSRSRKTCSMRTIQHQNWDETDDALTKGYSSLTMTRSTVDLFRFTTV